MVSEASSLCFSKELLLNFLVDQSSYITTNAPLFQFLFMTDYQDYLVTIFYHSPELITALLEFAQVYWFNVYISSQPATLGDLFSDNLSSTIVEFIEYWVLFLFYVWATILVINLLRILN